MDGCLQGLFQRLVVVRVVEINAIDACILHVGQPMGEVVEGEIGKIGVRPDSSIHDGSQVDRFSLIFGGAIQTPRRPWWARRWEICEEGRRAHHPGFETLLLAFVHQVPGNATPRRNENHSNHFENLRRGETCNARPVAFFPLWCLCLKSGTMITIEKGGGLPRMVDAFWLLYTCGRRRSVAGGS
jgi:hypothetical protein